MDTKTFLPLSDAALRLHLSYNQTYRLMLTGQLESRRTNSRRIEVTEADVDRLAREQAQHGAEPASVA